MKHDIKQPTRRHSGRCTACFRRAWRAPPVSGGALQAAKAVDTDADRSLVAPSLTCLTSGSQLRWARGFVQQQTKALALAIRNRPQRRQRHGAYTTRFSTCFEKRSSPAEPRRRIRASSRSAAPPLTGSALRLEFRHLSFAFLPAGSCAGQPAADQEGEREGGTKNIVCHCHNLREGGGGGRDRCRCRCHCRCPFSYHALRAGLGYGP